MYSMLQIIKVEVLRTGAMETSRVKKNTRGMIPLLSMQAVYTSMIRMHSLELGILMCIDLNYIPTIMNCSSLKTYGQCVPAIISMLSIMTD